MVPILRRNVVLLKDTYFKEPSHKMPYNHVVWLPEGADGDTIIAQRGNLSRLSAEEGDFAFIMAVAERIQAGATEDELKLWRAMALKITIEFRIVKAADKGFAAINERRHFLMAYETLSRSCVQTIFGIVDWKYEYEKKHGELSDKEVAAAYNKGLVKMDGVQEDAVSDYFVEFGIRAYNRILSVPACHDLVMEDGFLQGSSSNIVSCCISVPLQEENLRGKASIFNSISVLQALVEKCGKEPEHMLWTLRTMKDLVQCEFCHPKELHAKALSGKNTGHKGEIALWLMKRSFLQWLATSWMGSVGFVHADIDLVSNDLSGHEKFRALCGRPGMKADISWQSLLPSSTRKLVQLLETMVYGVRFDGAWKLSMKGTSDPSEIAKTEPFKDCLAEIEELVVKDRPQQDVEEEKGRVEASQAAHDVNKQKILALLSEEACKKMTEEQTEQLIDFVAVCDP